LEEFQGRYLSHFITIDRSLFEIEEIRKNFGRVLEFYSLGESREFFCNLEMVERKNDISQVVKDDFDRRLVHFLPLPFIPSPLEDWVAIVALVEETVGFQSVRMRSFRNE
jgi:hypothetical protein